MSVTTANDNVYVNIVINGPSTMYPPTIGNAVVNEQPVIAEYSENKTEPFLSTPSEYYLSVIRFTVPLNKVPLFIMPIIPNQGNPNESTLAIGFTYLTTNYESYVTYIPDNNLSAPVQNAPVQVVTPYYYVYSYGALIAMFNATLSALWTSSGLAAVYPSLIVPYFYYNTTLELVQLIVPHIFADGSVVLSMFINESSLRFLDAFQFKFNGYNNVAGNDYYFVLQNQTQFFYPPYSGTGTSTYYIYTQEYNMLYYWASLRKIVITSNGLPILNEIIPAPGNSGVSVSFPIITDFVPQISDAGDTKSIAIYNPSSQYRLVDLTGSVSLSKLDIRLYWQDIAGNLYNIFISSGQQVTLKLGFFKKSLYKNTINTRK